MYAKNGAVFVTNTASNNVSVIDTASDKVVQTIATQPWPEASVGYEPDAVTLTDDGHLLVTLGRANAVAVYRYTSPQEPVSYVGLLPTDYFPAEITTVGNTVVVSNTRGIDARRSAGTGARHPRHHVEPDAVHAAERPRHQAARPAKVFARTAGPRAASSSPATHGHAQAGAGPGCGSATPRRSSTSS